MAEAKSTRKKTASKAGAAKKSAAPKTAAAKAETVSRGTGLRATTPGTTLATLRENAGARPKRLRIGRGHGSGMVKTGGEGGKGQTVRSGGGKGPAFEGGQTPWARRLAAPARLFAEGPRHGPLRHDLCGRQSGLARRLGPEAST